MSRVMLGVGALAGALLLASSCTLDTAGAGADDGSSGGTGAFGGGGADDGGATGGSSGSSGSAGSGGSGAGGTGGDGGAAGDGGAGTGGVSGSSGTAGSGGTSGSGGSAGTGGSTGSEDCGNGMDDDGDGSVDCADSDCGAYACVVEAPAGWEGYFGIREETWSPTMDPGPACVDGSTARRTFQEPATAACTACACDAMTGGSCGATPILCDPGNDSCSSTDDWTNTLSSGDCKKPAGDWIGQLSCRLGTTPVQAAGTCAPVPAMVDGAKWGRVADVCGGGPVGAGCSSGEVCALRQTGEYGGFVCIRKAGDHACPADWGLRVLTHEDGSDTRSCEPCSCAPDAGSATCTGGKYTVYDDNGCSDSARDITSTSCRDVSGSVDWGSWSIRRTGLPSVTGTCTPSGGAPTGGVALTGTETYCCR